MVLQTRTPKDVSKILQVDIQTVTRMFRQGELGGGKVGGRWRITDEVLLEYLRNKNLIPSGENITVESLLT